MSLSDSTASRAVWDLNAPGDDEYPHITGAKSKNQDTSVEMRTSARQSVDHSVDSNRSLIGRIGHGFRCKCSLCSQHDIFLFHFENWMQERL
jgi:hypothetical protein